MSGNPNLGRQFEQLPLPGIESESVEQKFDPGEDRPRFSAIPGQQLFDFGDRAAQAPSTTYTRSLRSPTALEHEAHGFIHDPTLPEFTYDANDLYPDLPTVQRTLGPDHPLHTQQLEEHTGRRNPATAVEPEGLTIEELRDIPEFATRPLVMRTEGRDVVINGHHRIAAARRRGEGNIDVDYMDADAHRLDVRDPNWVDTRMYQTPQDPPRPLDYHEPPPPSPPSGKRGLPTDVKWDPAWGQEPGDEEFNTPKEIPRAGDVKQAAQATEGGMGGLMQDVMAKINELRAQHQQRPQ